MSFRWHIDCSTIDRINNDDLLLQVIDNKVIENSPIKRIISEFFCKKYFLD